MNGYMKKVGKTLLFGVVILAVALLIYWVYIIIGAGSIESKAIITLVIWGAYILTIIGLSLK